MFSLPVLLLSLLLSAGSSSAAAAASDCTLLEAPEAFDRASLVFTGRVISGELPRNAIIEEEILIGYLEGVRYQLVVDEVFKGALPDTVEVWGGAGIGLYGYDFSIGGRYLVFAFKYRRPRDDRDFVPMEGCTPTAPLHNAEETLAYLRADPK